MPPIVFAIPSSLCAGDTGLKSFVLVEVVASVEVGRVTVVDPIGFIIFFGRTVAGPEVVALEVETAGVALGMSAGGGVFVVGFELVGVAELLRVSVGSGDN